MTGSPEALDQIQDNANWEAAKQMAEGLISATGKMDGAVNKGPGTYRGEGTPGSGRRW
jgi:hypothetical protein